MDPHQTGFVGNGSDHLQLIKFWPSHVPGRGSAAGWKFLAPPYYSQHTVFASLWALFSFDKVFLMVYVRLTCPINITYLLTYLLTYVYIVPTVLCHCWLGRKWEGQTHWACRKLNVVGMLVVVIWLELCKSYRLCHHYYFLRCLLHCCSKIHNSLTFLHHLTEVVLKTGS